MNKQEIYDFLNENTVASIATTDGEKPYVRNIWTVKTDEKGVLFHTSKTRDLFQQILRYPYAEMCFLNKDQSVQVRVSGKVRMIEDIDLKNELADKRPFLREIEKKVGHLDFFAVFQMEECRATVWTMATNMQPKEFIEI